MNERERPGLDALIKKISEEEECPPSADEMPIIEKIWDAGYDTGLETSDKALRNAYEHLSCHFGGCRWRSKSFAHEYCRTHQSILDAIVAIKEARGKA